MKDELTLMQNLYFALIDGNHYIGENGVDGTKYGIVYANTI